MAGKKRAGGGAKAFMKAVMSRGDSSKDVAEPVSLQTTSPAEDDSPADSADLTAQTEPQATSSLNETAIGASTHQDAAAAIQSQMEDISVLETKGQMQQRHKKELKSLKEAMKKLGKKRKEETDKLESETAARHAAEAAALGAAAASAQLSELQDASVATGNGMQKELSAAMPESQPQKESSRAQKRREKEAQKQAARDARIAEEQASYGDSKRQQEEEALAQQLLPHGLVLRDIPPDGNCLYRAVEDQLQQGAQTGSNCFDDRSGSLAAADPSSSLAASGAQSHEGLRAAAVDYMREHEDDFAPFILPEAGGDAREGDEGASEQFQQYCDTMAGPAVWGGQAELSALTHVVQRPIRVFSVGMPPVLMGEQYTERGEPLQISFQRHAYELGEHYNSLVPARPPQPENLGRPSSDWSMGMQAGF